MADNLLINTGTGITIASDEVGTAHYQKIKLVVGPPDTVTPLVFGETNMAASLPVVIANNQTTVPVSVLSFVPGGTQNVNVVAFTPGGTQNVSVIGTPTVTASQGGTWNVATVSTVLGTIAISGTASTIPTGTQNVAVVSFVPGGTQNVNVVAFTPGGTQNVIVIGTPTVTASQGGSWNIATVSTLLGTVTVSGTVNANSTPVAPTTKWNGYAVNVNSSNTILMTSGGHTLYVTDLMFSVDVPMGIKFFSAGTAKGEVYLATKGGFVMNLNTPLVLNSGQSLTFTPSVSGSCAGFACGYTVT